MTLEYPKIRTTLPGPKAAALVARDAQFVSPSYTRDYPLVVERAYGCVIEDPDGNTFLDCTAGIAVTATGHCHPTIVAAITEQAAKLIHMSGTDFYYAPQIDLAERLAGLAPGKTPKKVFMCNSGTEAIEGALKLARYATGRPYVIGFFGSFHGRTLGALSVTASKQVQRERFAPLMAGTFHAPYPDPYRCPDGMTPEQYATFCVGWIRDRLFATIAPANEVAAILAESIQGEGGYVVPPANFFPELRALCDEHGILLICDEVQSGAGRTGKYFAIEHERFSKPQGGAEGEARPALPDEGATQAPVIEPDIIAMAKGVASGLPLGAVIAKADVMRWKPGAHASTFGGNPVACAAALATTDLLEQGLMRNAVEQGDYLQTRLRALQAAHPCIGDVRGRGLMVGMELVKDRTTKARAKALRDAIIQRAFTKGLLLLGCGANTIRFCPPLIMTRAEIDIAVRITQECLVEETS